MIFVDNINIRIHKDYLRIFRYAILEYTYLSGHFYYIKLQHIQLLNLVLHMKYIHCYLFKTYYIKQDERDYNKGIERKYL